MVRQTPNQGCADFNTAILALEPLLAPLNPGLYVIVDGDAYPVDGDGHFFWDVPNELTTFQATGMIRLNDGDYDWEYPSGAPVFLYPTQRRPQFDPQRVKH